MKNRFQTLLVRDTNFRGLTPFLVDPVKNYFFICCPEPLFLIAFSHYLMKSMSKNIKIYPKCDDLMKMTPKKHQSLSKMRGPHENDIQKHQDLSEMRRAHENDAQKASESVQNERSS